MDKKMNMEKRRRWTFITDKYPGGKRVFGNTVEGASLSFAWIYLRNQSVASLDGLVGFYERIGYLKVLDDQGNVLAEINPPHP